MKRHFLSIICAVIVLSAASVQAEMVFNFTYPETMEHYVPCANEGIGETVSFEGDMHCLMNITDHNNSRTVVLHCNAQGVEGIGEITGDKYQTTGGIQLVEQFTPHVHIKHEFVVGQHFRVTGQGAGNDLMLRHIVHLTETETGTKVEIDNPSIVCK